jgi:hypothetical protein
MACLGMLVPIVAVQVPAPADAAVYRVPEDRDRIQAGILAAADGDTVLVAPGSYVENILIDRDVVVRSTGGAAVTIIDGSQPANPDSGSVVTFFRSRTLLSSASIEGFDIRGGSGTRENSVDVGGGGVFVNNAWTGAGSDPGPLIMDNWIHDNLLRGDETGIGAGIRIYGTARVVNNRIFSNGFEVGIIVASGSAIHGGGFITQAPILVQGNEVFDNRAHSVPLPPTEHGGPAIALGQPVILHNLIACNYGLNSIASALVVAGGDGIVESNTIVANATPEILPAVRLGYASSANITFINNNVSHNLGPGVECGDCTGCVVSLACNNIFGNTPGGEIIGACSDAIGQDGNISVDPLYGREGCPNTVGNWCLSESSPLLTDPPAGCGLIGAMGLCPPIGIAEREAPRAGAGLDARAPSPNPFFARTTIGFFLRAGAEVEIGIYNVLGQRVRRLSPRWLFVGEHELDWDGRDDDGRRVPSGGYVARIVAGGDEVTRTLLLVR